MRDTSKHPVLSINNDLPIRTSQPVHSGKVRAVYWLRDADSARLIRERNYQANPDAQLGIMVISDRISAFECIWHGEHGLHGVPGKGAALNAIAHHWFTLLEQRNIAENHILEVPHPLFWVVQRAKPVRIEAIVRQYITGSMLRAYQKGERTFCGNRLPDNLKPNQKLDQPIVTPSTKGVLSGLAGIPEADDVNVSKQDILNHLQAFNFASASDVDVYERLLTHGFLAISDELARIGQLFVDTKFEFGYIDGKLRLIDEVGTPDSSRLWDAQAYARGEIVENSKEGFRQFLLNHIPDADVLLDKNRMQERAAVAAKTILPAQAMLDVSRVYVNMAEKITGQALPQIDQPRDAIVNVLRREFDLI